MRALVILALVASPALADSDCEAVRRTLTLASRHNVDVGGLRQLEPRVCSAVLKPTPSTCEQLSEFWMLAMALKQPGELISALEAQRAVWCDREAEPARMLQWPEGNMLRSTTGTLSWPNGVIARSATGSWSSPEGVLVRSSSLALSYPGGGQARSSSGRWSLQSGELTDEGRIASLACSNDLQWCRFFLSEASRSTGAAHDFAMLGLGVLAGRE